MDKVKLPRLIDPLKSAMKRSTYVGVYSTSLMERFVGSVIACEDNVFMDVKFLKDAQSLTYFLGTATTQATLLCQRCNHEFSHPINVEFCFSPVQGTDTEEELPEAFEPVEVIAGAIDEGWIEVKLLKPLENSVTVAWNNAYYLLAEMKKGEAEHNH